MRPESRSRGTRELRRRCRGPCGMKLPFRRFALDGHHGACKSCERGADPRLARQGHLVRDAREDAGLGLVELALETGSTAPELSRIENGKTWASLELLIACIRTCIWARHRVMMDEIRARRGRRTT
jgi:hypothetical protein